MNWWKGLKEKKEEKQEKKEESPCPEERQKKTCPDKAQGNDKSSANPEKAKCPAAPLKLPKIADMLKPFEAIGILGNKALVNADMPGADAGGSKLGAIIGLMASKALAAAGVNGYNQGYLTHKNWNDETP
ncbi:hypothetical protein [Paenibacillus tengchongensis]|uniref:hypothetical protein n=1 Tax=Paenibacillus tengchongensis TaxID=2608684 RepID=UPI00124E9CE9|nr:hypothetical protein [Paenibacillus tengchongensis]